MADRETIVTGGGGSGGMIAAILIVALAVILGYFLFFNGSFGTRTVDVNVPAVKVDVVPDGQ
jgi:hypothetical protein